MLAYLTDRNGTFTHRNVVFVLGAGASYDSGYPLISEFLSPKYLKWLCDQCAARGTDDVYPPTGQEPLPYALEEAKALSQISTHFEEVLSICYEERTCYDRAVAFANWTLASAWSLAHSSAFMTTAEFLGLAMMLTTLNEVGQSCVITFNYDTTVEDSLASLARIRHVEEGLDTMPVSSLFNYCFRNPICNLMPKRMINAGNTVLPIMYPNGRIPVLKLHGSVTMTICSHCSALHYSPREALTPVAKSSDLIEEFTTCKACGHVSLRVLLTPPGKRKALAAEFEELWQSAHDLLSSADLVVLAGYSLPAYDTEARSLLQATLRKKDVLVIDPYPNMEAVKFLSSAAESNLLVLHQCFSEFLAYEVDSFEPSFIQSVAKLCTPQYMFPEKLQGLPRS